jgi:hypothetical protein
MYNEVPCTFKYFFLKIIELKKYALMINKKQNINRCKILGKKINNKKWKKL